jgi:TBCC domain-containing protein 1
MAHNDVLYPPENIFREAPDRFADMVMNANRTTVFRHQADIPNVVNLTVASCSDSVIYIAAHVPYVHVISCSDCKIVVCAVSRVLSMQHCERVSVHVASSALKLDNCVDCRAYVYCRTPPILTGDTRGIALGPFNVVYSELPELLGLAGLALEEEHVNTWAYPVCSTLGMGASMQAPLSDGLTDFSTYQVIDPEVWLPTSIPEARKATARLCLPQVYSDAFAAHVEEVGQLLQQMATLDDASRHRAQTTTQGYFREWLSHTGKSRQLTDLARMEQGLARD